MWGVLFPIPLGNLQFAERVRGVWVWAEVQVLPQWNNSSQGFTSCRLFILVFRLVKSPEPFDIVESITDNYSVSTQELDNLTQHSMIQGECQLIPAPLI